MKILKFRARIKENGKSIMFYQNDQYLISFLRRVTSFLAFEKDGKDRHESYLDNYSLEKCLDLFVGRKDRKKREIYTGDIIKDNSGKIIVEGLCHAKKIIKEPTSAITDFLWEEIIGNTYENSNLLKELK